MATFPDLEIEWLQSNGATSNNREDAWREFLNLQGFPVGAINDAMFQWLRSQGYIGALNEMWDQFWEACPVIPPVGASTWIDSEGWTDSEAWID